MRQAGCELDAVLSASRRFLGSRSFPHLIRVGDPHAGTYVCSRCGRFTHRHAWADIHRMYRLTSPASNVLPSYTVCATDTVNVVTSFQDTRILEPMRWVPIPTLASKPLKDLMRLSTFSARVETVTTKPFFREAFKRTRCLIPASGYYEWQDGDGIAVRECRQQTSATIDRPRRSGARHLSEDDRLTDAHAAILPQFEASAARICSGFIPHCVTPKLTKV